MGKDSATTDLCYNQTVRKDDLRIEFRGVLDGAIAETAYCAAMFYCEGNERYVSCLNDITACLMEIMGADVLRREPKLPTVGERDFTLWHEMSHDPMKYFGKTHFVPKAESGVALAYLNVIRTKVRDAERAFIRAYCDSIDCVPNADICLALNRISSVIYVLMCEYETKK